MGEGWSYLSPDKEAFSEFKERGSKFIGLLSSAGTPDDAMRFLEGLRKSYHDATHHCWAYRTGWGKALQSRSSDDGEPSGTAGAPILASLEKRGVSDACLVVVRYFGGTKLGTGNLMRAYRASARFTLEAASLVKHVLCSDWSIELPWGAQGVLRHRAGTLGIRLTEESSGQALRLHAKVPMDSEATFLSYLENLKSHWKGAVSWKSR